MADASSARSWQQVVDIALRPGTLKLLFLGFSAGLPYALIFSTLSFWLADAGVDRAAITFFGWATLGYSFKFVWAPLVDQLPLPWLTPVLGRRRAWLLFAQLAIVGVLLWMSSIDPVAGDGALVMMALAATALGFSAATQDIVIDAYRIECADDDAQTLLATLYMSGYRIAMITSGAGALYLATGFGATDGTYVYAAWQKTYLTMAWLMAVGIATTLIISEPEVERTRDDWKPVDHLRFVLSFALAVLALILVYRLTGAWADVASARLAELFGNRHLGALPVVTLRLLTALAAALGVLFACIRTGVVAEKMVYRSYIEPVAEFFRRYGMRLALLLLALIGLYRISDIVLGMIANVFYYETGFSKNDIATASKIYGLIMTILGGFIGGALALRFGVMRLLYAGAIFCAATNLLFVGLHYIGPELWALYIVLSFDNLAQGLSLSVFIAFLSSLTNVSFTAIQYAIFSSFMTLLPKVIGGYSGTIVNAVGYPAFFTFTALIGVPIIWLVWRVQRELRSQNSQPKPNEALG